MTVLALSVLTPLAGADDPKDAVKTPDTPAGRLLAGWLGALGTGEPEALQRFIAENYSKGVLARGSAQQRAAGGIRLYQINGGGPELARIERSSAHELVALARFPVTESWLCVSVKVAPKPPRTVTRWTVASHPPPEPGNAKRLSDEEIAARAEAYLAKLMAADLFSGSVVVAHDGKPILCRAYGLASRAHGVPNRTDTKFNLGSMDKMFTAVDVAQLAERRSDGVPSPESRGGPDAQAAARARADRKGAAQPSVARQQRGPSSACRGRAVVSSRDPRGDTHRGVIRREDERTAQRSYRGRL